MKKIIVENEAQFSAALVGVAAGVVSKIEIVKNLTFLNSVTLPRLKNNRLLIIDGQGCKINFVTGGFSTTLPLSQANADDIVNMGYVLEWIEFIGQGSSAITLAATNYSEINRCKFSGFDLPVNLLFSLNCEMYRNQFNYSRLMSVSSDYGKWPGASPSLAPSNVFRFIQNRILSESAVTEIQINQGAATILEQNTFEGGGTDHVGGGTMIEFLGGVNCNSIRIIESYFELKAKDQLIRINSREGNVVIDGLRNVYDNLIINAEATGNTRLHLDNIHRLTGGSKFKSDADTFWRVGSFPGASRLLSGATWNGPPPTNITVED